MKQLLPFETVIFDLDGTLAQSAPGVFQCVTEALQRMNKPIPCLLYTSAPCCNRFNCRHGAWHGGLRYAKCIA